MGAEASKSLLLLLVTQAEWTRIYNYTIILLLYTIIYNWIIYNSVELKQEAHQLVGPGEFIVDTLTEDYACSDSITVTDENYE